MMPTFVTEIEREYDRKFPGNPATLFFPHDDKGEGAFSQMLKHAIETNTPITEEDVINFYGKDAYTLHKEYLDAWWEVYGMEPITWK